MTLLEFLDSEGIAYRSPGQHHHVSHHGWINIHCPWCGSSNFHLGIHVKSLHCNCWRCGSHDGIATLAQITRTSAHVLAKQISRELAPKKKQEKTTGKLQLPKRLSDLELPHIEYLVKRGFDPEEIVRIWKVKSISQAAKLQWRLFIPIFDADGKMASWTTRSISDVAERRYISAPTECEYLSHKDILYGSHLARHAIIIVEGPLDAWAIGPGAVATCGLSFSKSQVNKMLDYPVRVVCFDSEKEAQKRSEKLCKWLSGRGGITYSIELETGTDPANCSKEEIAELRQKYLD